MRLVAAKDAYWANWAVTLSKAHRRLRFIGERADVSPTKHQGVT
jgi:hypothetical protein